MGEEGRGGAGSGEWRGGADAHSAVVSGGAAGAGDAGDQPLQPGGAVAGSAGDPSRESEESSSGGDEAA